VNAAGVNAVGVIAAGVNAAGVNAAGVNAAGVNAVGVNAVGVNAVGVNAAGGNASEPLPFAVERDLDAPSDSDARGGTMERTYVWLIGQGSSDRPHAASTWLGIGTMSGRVISAKKCAASQAARCAGVHCSVWDLQRYPDLHADAAPLHVQAYIRQSI
jgi:hypothetical protein